MAASDSLRKAHDAKQDEFYTRREDIEAELSHYKPFFENKVVYCNCDDPKESEFWQFFVRVFKDWKLKKLMATHYEPDEKNFAYKLELSEDTNGGGKIDWNDEPVKTAIPCNGDFRSAACIELLKEADIVVTNPPFSLFREYVQQLMDYDKKFVIIGSINAMSYAEIFPLIKEDKLWTGYGFRNGNAYFRVPEWMDVSRFAKGVYNPETKLVHFRNCTWFTNLDIKKRHETLDLRGNYYRPELYPTYDNYNAIEVGKVADTPCDYEGIMGEPVTFLLQYSPDQFEIIGLDRYTVPKKDLIGGRLAVNGKTKYARILIRNKNPEPRRYPDEN